MYCINYVIRQGDTLYSLSRQFNVPLADIINANPVVNVYNLQVGEVICIPVSIPHDDYMDYTEYIIQQEDTLGSILERYGINLADLMMMNNINSIMLQPGTALQIPILRWNDEY